MELQLLDKNTMIIAKKNVVQSDAQLILTSKYYVRWTNLNESETI